MADPNLGQLAATTLYNRSSEVADDVTNNNALLAYLKKSGNIETRTGGRAYLEPTIFAENDTTKFYDGGMESFSIDISSQVDASEWERKFQAGFIYFTESERQANRDKHAAVRLIDAKIRALKATLSNDFSTAIYGDGTNAKEVVGLQAIVADDPTTGTVGGIDASTYAFWRNISNTATTASAANIISTMTSVWLSTIRGADKPDLVVAGNDMFTYYNDALQADQRFTSWDKADVLNFEGLRFQSAMVLFDPNCATKRMYGLNTKDFKLVCDPGRKWSTGSSRDVTNATYEVVPCLWSGALLTSRRASHFVIEGTSA